MHVGDAASPHPDGVSVLFSEPKIPQYIEGNREAWEYLKVSVLFSEPKIPQSSVTSQHARPVRVSVLFSEPKIPQ